MFADVRLSRGLLMLFCGTENNNQLDLDFYQSYMYMAMDTCIIVIRANMSSDTLNLRCCPLLCIA